MENGTTSQLSNVLDDISQRDPELHQRIQDWAERSPAEQVQGGRKLLYSVLEPALRESMDTSEIAEVEAVFEGIFKSVEQQTGSRSRSSQSRS